MVQARALERQQSAQLVLVPQQLVWLLWMALRLWPCLQQVLLAAQQGVVPWALLSQAYAWQA